LCIREESDSKFFFRYAIAALPHTRVFLAKSAELHENKVVAFLAGARKRKRVWNSLKRKDLNIMRSDEWRVANSGVARMTPTPLFL
jgi:hypothetical protein